MSRRDEWRRILDAEVDRWSAMTYDDLISALQDHQGYVVELESKHYQVDVEILEITEKYLQVVVAVNDVPAVERPLSRSFFCRTS
jgi:hypothetical protein